MFVKQCFWALPNIHARNDRQLIKHYFFLMCVVLFNTIYVYIPAQMTNLSPSWLPQGSWNSSAFTGKQPPSSLNNYSPQSNIYSHSQHYIYHNLISHMRPLLLQYRWNINQKLYNIILVSRLTRLVQFVCPDKMSFIYFVSCVIVLMTTCTLTHETKK